MALQGLTMPGQKTIIIHATDEEFATLTSHTNHVNRGQRLCAWTIAGITLTVNAMLALPRNRPDLAYLYRDCIIRVDRVQHRAVIRLYAAQ